jgi:hypothetical protein
LQREEVVRIRVVEGTQPKASGVQRGGGQQHARRVPSRDWWLINHTSDAGDSQRSFSAGGQNDVPAHWARTDVRDRSGLMADDGATLPADAL